MFYTGLLRKQAPVLDSPVEEVARPVRGAVAKPQVGELCPSARRASN